MIIQEDAQKTDSEEPRREVPLITLTTDFGFQDPFVGILHGVILARCPAARIVDLCHGIQPQNVLEAAFWLGRSFPWFPTGSVHVVVVDPGVGTERRALGVRASGHIFIGPDNGVLSGVLEGSGDVEVREIDVRALELHPASRTFHGRDVFAPVAAMLASRALRFEELGPWIQMWTRLSGLSGELIGGRAVGRVITIDRFGNLITNVPSSAIQAVGGEASSVHMEILGRRARLVGTYGEAQPGELVALVNAFETLEVAVREGCAAAVLGVGRGELVELSAGPAR